MANRHIFKGVKKNGLADSSGAHDQRDAFMGTGAIPNSRIRSSRPTRSGGVAPNVALKGLVAALMFQSLSEWLVNCFEVYDFCEFCVFCELLCFTSNIRVGTFLGSFLRL